MSDRMTLDEIAALCECSRRHIDDLRREDPAFPKPVKTIGGRKLLFRRDDVRRWRDRLLGNEQDAIANGVDPYVAGLNHQTAVPA